MSDSPLKDNTWRRQLVELKTSGRGKQTGEIKIFQGHDHCESFEECSYNWVWVKLFNWSAPFFKSTRSQRKKKEHQWKFLGRKHKKEEPVLRKGNSLQVVQKLQDEWLFFLRWLTEDTSEPGDKLHSSSGNDEKRGALDVSSSAVSVVVSLAQTFVCLTAME